MELRGRSALVTGAGRRVGRTIALGLARRGANVAVHYRSSRGGAMDTVRRIQAMGVEAAAIQGDLARTEEARRVVRRAERELGGLSVLVNCASVYEPRPWGATRESDWEKHMSANARGAFFAAQEAAKGMKKRRAGKIINIVDSDVTRPYRNYTAYFASKAALMGLTWALAVELAPEIQVNAVAPGAVLLPEGWGPKIRRSIINATPLKRIGSPEDIARTVVFLIEGSDFITGAVIPVDGGRHLG